MSKLSDYLKKNKIDARRILLASDKIEKSTPADRKIRLAKRDAKIGGDVPEKVKEVAAKKPRSGRPVVRATLDAALAGTPISGPAKTRIVRALNAVLATKKKGEVTFRDLF